MRVLLLTDTTHAVGGWGTVTDALVRGVAQVDPDVTFDVFTSERGGYRLQRNSLKSQFISKKTQAVCLLDVWNVLRNCEQRFDLIHAMVEHYALPAMLLSRIKKTPYLVTAHGTYGVSLPCKRTLYKKAFGAADRVVAVSNYTKMRMSEEGVTCRYSVVNPGVDKERFSLDPTVTKDGGITFVGNLKARKGLLFLLEALADLKKAGHDYPLWIIGKIDERASELERIKTFIAANGLTVNFTGRLPEEEILSHYRKAKLNILPSKSGRFNFEGFGLVHLEANACGTLSVGTFDSGNEDAIKPGNGFMVKYGDVGSLSKIIHEVMTDKHAAPPQGAIRSYVDMASQYVDIYREILSGAAS